MPVQYPKCYDKRKDCTACIKGGKCAALSETDPFTLKCSFYRCKTEMTVGELAKYYSAYLGREAKLA